MELSWCPREGEKSDEKLCQQSSRDCSLNSLASCIPWECSLVPASRIPRPSWGWGLVPASLIPRTFWEQDLMPASVILRSPMSEKVQLAASCSGHLGPLGSSLASPTAWKHGYLGSCSVALTTTQASRIKWWCVLPDHYKLWIHSRAHNMNSWSKVCQMKPGIARQLANKVLTNQIRGPHRMC